MRLNRLMLLGLLFMGCEQAKNEPIAITPTTGEFTAQDEAVYQERLGELIKAFSTGQETTKYDTEVEFGQSLVETPLPRGNSDSLSSELIANLMGFAEDQQSDSFVIVENGQVVAEKYFGEISRGSLINAKSLAKPLGVIAIGRAIKLGYIDSLDQPVSDFIVEWQGTDKDAIKIRHILDMRSGFLPQKYTKETEAILNRAYLHPRHDEVIIHEYPMVSVPGERYDYSNANSELVAVVIKRATSQTYADWLTHEVLASIGARGGKIWMNRYGGTAHSGCCMALTSEVFVKLGLLVLQKGKWGDEEVISSEFVEEMLTATPQNIYAGMGVYLGKHYIKERGASNPDGVSGFDGTLHSEPYIDKDIALFDGNGHQVVYIMPSRNLVIMRLGARPKTEVPWDNVLIPNAVSSYLDNLE